MRLLPSGTWRIFLPRRTPRAKSQQRQMSTFVCSNTFKIKEKTKTHPHIMVTGPPAMRQVIMGLDIAKADNRTPFHMDLDKAKQDTYARP